MVEIDARARDAPRQRNAHPRDERAQGHRLAHSAARKHLENPAVLAGEQGLERLLQRGSLEESSGLIVFVGEVAPYVEVDAAIGMESHELALGGNVLDTIDAERVPLEEEPEQIPAAGEIEDPVRFVVEHLEERTRPVGRDEGSVIERVVAHGAPTGHEVQEQRALDRHELLGQRGAGGRRAAGEPAPEVLGARPGLHPVHTWLARHSLDRVILQKAFEG
ncbi:hypothetical protein WME90_42645 [Sorangium sp. So ce375]|uniref:hypothetical protein n=1 Tax=Sorangium sp. So ce375 TaxID=3133306 RepID=UPI003F5C1723